MKIYKNILLGIFKVILMNVLISIHRHEVHGASSRLRKAKHYYNLRLSVKQLPKTKLSK